MQNKIEVAIIILFFIMMLSITGVLISHQLMIGSCCRA